MGVNASIEGSNPSFSVSVRPRRPSQRETPVVTDLLAFMQIPGWTSDLIRAGAVVAGALLLSWGIRRRVQRWAQLRPEDTADLVRLRRRETAAALLSSVSRYTLMLVSTVLVLGIFLRSSLTAAAGASLVAVLIGFGAQRFLQDVIAGFFILAEGQYGVGDFIVVEPTKAAGVVDELGLRTTILRNLNGDRSIVPNGQITAVH